MLRSIHAGLKIRILLPLALMLVILLVSFVYTLYQNERNDSKQTFARDLQAAATHYQHDLEQHASGLVALLGTLQRDASIQTALRTRDRTALLRETAALYKNLHEQHAITHLTFVDAARVAIFRPHDPEHFGDTLDGQTLLEAQQTGASAHGLELNKDGSLTLQAVAALHDHQGLIGYIALGEEAERIVHNMTDILNVEHISLLDKRHLNRADWEAGMRRLGRAFNWERLADHIVMHQTLELTNQQLLRVLTSNAISEPAIDDRPHYAKSLDIVDHAGRVVSKIILLRDRTQTLANIATSLRALGGFFLALGGSLFFLLYLVVQRTENHLTQAHQRELDLQRERETLQAQHIAELEMERNKLRDTERSLQDRSTTLARAQQIAHLGSWKWDIARDRLEWSEEIYRIFGIMPGEFDMTYAAFIRHVHPEDQDYVRQAVDAALTDNRPYDIEHRIRRPDGVTRVVMERADVERDADGKAMLMTGTVQDITERRRAEDELRLTSQVFENSIEGILITDVNNNILRVNRAFSSITGYAEKDILGRNPRLLSSGRHDTAYYQTMWASLLEYGYWQGEIWNRRKNGDIYPEWLSLFAIRNERGETTHYAGVFADLTEKKQAEAHVQYLAHYDPLTELPNRQLLEERMQLALHAARDRQRMVALLYLDLDRFRFINESLGHEYGDKLLQAVTRRLTEQVRGSDTLARFSGDEFAVLLSDIGALEDARQIADKIRLMLTQPFNLDEHEIFVTPSIGIAIYPRDGETTADLYRAADTAMNSAKAQGGNAARFYSIDMNHGASHRLTLESGLRRALEREEFLLYYQPQVSLHSGEVIGMEALLRWQNPERGLISPAEFIPLLEETGLIIPVGEWVLRTACSQTALWQQSGLPVLRVAVNLSQRQFHEPDMLSVIERALRDSGLPPAQLELEVTESLMIRDMQTTITTLHQLHAIGIQISIDDFGTGYSSLGYLKKLPINKIKIDQSFVRDICSDPDDAAIASTIIALGHSLRMQVIAEGVETAEQLSHLRAQGCDEIQGYYFSKPLPAEEFARLIAGKRLLTN